MFRKVRSSMRGNSRVMREAEGDTLVLSAPRTNILNFRRSKAAPVVLGSVNPLFEGAVVVPVDTTVASETNSSKGCPCSGSQTFSAEKFTLKVSVGAKVLCNGCTATLSDLGAPSVGSSGGKLVAVCVDCDSSLCIQKCYPGECWDSVKSAESVAEWVSKLHSSQEDELIQSGLLYGVLYDPSLFNIMLEHVLQQPTARSRVIVGQVLLMVCSITPDSFQHGISLMSQLEVLVSTARSNGALDQAMEQHAFSVACEHGNVEQMCLFLRSDSVDPSLHNQRAITVAATHGRVRVVMRLLRDPRVDPGHNRDQPIRDAAARGHTEVVRQLIRHSKVNPAAMDNLATRSAACKGDVETLRVLLRDARVDPNTGLSDAINLCQLEATLVLLDDPRSNPLQFSNAFNKHLASSLRDSDLLTLIQQDPRIGRMLTKDTLQRMDASGIVGVNLHSVR